MGNYKNAWTDVKGLIDRDYLNYPKHQGITDITEVIEFARLSEEHGLSDEEYESLIAKAEKYHNILSNQ